MTSSRQETVLPGKGQKGRIKTDEVPVVFGDGGCQIVVPEFACDPTQELESVDVTAHKRLEALAVSELHLELATVAFHQAESIELAQMALIEQGAEVAPVDFEALPRANVFHALHFRLAAGFFGIVRKHFQDFAVRRLGEVGGAIPFARHLRGATGMVRVLVGDQDGVQAFGALAAKRFKASQRFFAANAGINEESGVLSFEQRRVARAARSQNGDTERDAALFV